PAPAIEPEPERSVAPPPTAPPAPAEALRTFAPAPVAPPAAPAPASLRAHGTKVAPPVQPSSPTAVPVPVQPSANEPASDEGTRSPKLNPESPEEEIAAAAEGEASWSTWMDSLV